MANLRIVDFLVADVRTIRARFTDRLDPLIGISNVTVASLVPGVPDAEVIGIQIKDDKITVTTRPLTPMAAYLVAFKSTSVQSFKNVNGNAFVLEDGRTNVRQINGPEDPSNQVRDNLVSFLKDNVYDLNRRTLVRFVINQVATDLLRAHNDIRQAKNDNYLDLRITDERHTRGKGPFDRLFEEGAFQVLRVGRTPTNAKVSLSFSFDTFPFDPITLLRKDVQNEELEAGNNTPGTFSSDLLLNLLHSPVTVLKSVVFKYQSGSTFTYSISSLGYQINNPRYDTQFASTLVTLEDNQIQLNSEVLADSGFDLPGAGDTIVVSYEHKSVGRTIDESTVRVSQVLDAVRQHRLY